MRVPLGWLREYVTLENTTGEIVAKLAMLGFPVEAIERRPQLSGVVSGRIERVTKHPNADRLHVCSVNAGGAAPLTIATAAGNVAEGQIVPVALIGAKLAGLEIAPRTMRGIDSQGMLVSAGEIGLEPAWFEDGILQLETSLELGIDLIEAYRLNDDIIEVEVTSNRVDAMSVLGIARELAAAYGLPLREPLDFAPVPTLDAKDARHGDLRVTLESADCRRYVAQRFDGPGMRVAPMWMRVRLALAGQRPLGDIVDVTNYVMLELAQPLHAFDFARIDGAQIVARDAREGEIITTLDGQTRTLEPAVLVIAGARKAEAVAGVIGGAGSEVSESTRSIVIESANFAPARVRRSARSLGVRTEASSRHERALSAAMPDTGSQRARQLLLALGWQDAPAFAVGSRYQPPAPIHIAPAAVGNVLGFEVSGREIEAALRGLGFAVHAVANGFEVVPPPWRTDVTLPVDLIEEVARIVGYDRVPSLVPPVFEQQVSSSAYDREAEVARALSWLGYRECISFSLGSDAVVKTYVQAGLPAPQQVEVRNPLSEDQRFARFSLLPGLLQIAARQHAGETVRLFEIGHVFRQEDAPVESALCTALFVTPQSGGVPWRDEHFLAVKGDLETLLRRLTGVEPSSERANASELHPGKTVDLLVNGERVVTLGAIDPRLGAAYDLSGNACAAHLFLDQLPACRLPRYREPSRFPAIERDLAVVVDPEVAAGTIVATIAAAGDGLLRDVRVFDEYRGPQLGEGKKSVAVRLLLQRDDATLTDDEAEREIGRILRALESNIGAVIRR